MAITLKPRRTSGIRSGQRRTWLAENSEANGRPSAGFLAAQAAGRTAARPQSGIRSGRLWLPTPAPVSDRDGYAPCAANELANWTMQSPDGAFRSVASAPTPGVFILKTSANNSVSFRPTGNGTVIVITKGRQWTSEIYPIAAARDLYAGLVTAGYKAR